MTVHKMYIQTIANKGCLSPTDYHSLEYNIIAREAGTAATTAIL